MQNPKIVGSIIVSSSNYPATTHFGFPVKTLPTFHKNMYQLYHDGQLKDCTTLNQSHKIDPHGSIDDNFKEKIYTTTYYKKSTIFLEENK